MSGGTISIAAEYTGPIAPGRLTLHGRAEVEAYCRACQVQLLRSLVDELISYPSNEQRFDYFAWMQESARRRLDGDDLMQRVEQLRDLKRRVYAGMLAHGIQCAEPIAPDLGDQMELM